MQHAYRLGFLLTLWLLMGPAARAQDWRPFKYRSVHSFRTAGSDTIYTLRLDSAYTVGADSVYRFRRILRNYNFGLFRKTPNNIFGGQLIVRANAEYVLVQVADNGRSAKAVLLRPRSAVGATWPIDANSTVTATLTSRVAQPLAGTPDTVATITLSDGRVFKLARKAGLVQAPKWLSASTQQPQLVLERWPAAVSPYHQPAVVYDFQPGDEFGYMNYPFMSTDPCWREYRLRRYLTRQQTPDSLIYSYIEQTVHLEFGPARTRPTCAPASVSYRTIQSGRLALPLRLPTTSYLSGLVGPLALLTYEYAAPYAGAGSSIPPVVALPGKVVATCGITSVDLPFGRLVNSPPGYSFLPDFTILTQFRTSFGESKLGDNTELVYYRRQFNGATQTCGSFLPFSDLLPTRTARAAARFAVYPNPAAHEASISLAAPAPAGTRLTLHDATGRRVGQWDVNRGQTATLVPLANLPAGVYVVQLHLPGEAPVALRLQHLP